MHIHTLRPILSHGPVWLMNPIFSLLFCPDTDLCGHNSLFVAKRRALNCGSRQKGTCWKGGDMKWITSEGSWSIMLEWCIEEFSDWRADCSLFISVFLLSSSISSEFTAPIHNRLFSSIYFTCLYLTTLKIFSPPSILSWWCHYCYACWTGAWLFPWVCCWSPSPCLRWRTTHRTRPHY